MVCQLVHHTVRSFPSLVSVMSTAFVPISAEVFASLANSMLKARSVLARTLQPAALGLYLA